MKKSFASDQIFSTVSDVPSRPCSPDVQHHPGHRIHSDHLDSFLIITGRQFWAIAVRRCVSALKNVAPQQCHPHVTTHPKLVRILFRCLCVPPVAPSRRCSAHMCILRAVKQEVTACHHNCLRELCPTSCFWCRHQIAPSLLLPAERKETGQSGQTNTWDRWM